MGSRALLMATAHKRCFRRNRKRRRKKKRRRRRLKGGVLSKKDGQETKVEKAERSRELHAAATGHLVEEKRKEKALQGRQKEREKAEGQGWGSVAILVSMVQIEASVAGRLLVLFQVSFNRRRPKRARLRRKDKREQREETWTFREGSRTGAAETEKKMEKAQTTPRRPWRTPIGMQKREPSPCLLPRLQPKSLS